MIPSIVVVSTVAGEDLQGAVIADEGDGDFEKSERLAQKLVHRGFKVERLYGFFESLLSAQKRVQTGIRHGLILLRDSRLSRPHGGKRKRTAGLMPPEHAGIIA